MKRPFSKQKSRGQRSLKAATESQPPALPGGAPGELTEEQRLETEGSDEVIPVGDQLDLALMPHLRESGTAGSQGGGGKGAPARGAAAGE